MDSKIDPGYTRALPVSGTPVTQWPWASVTLSLRFFTAYGRRRTEQRVRDSGSRWLLRHLARAAGDTGYTHTPVSLTVDHPFGDPTRVHVTFHTQWRPEPLFPRGHRGVMHP